jgi:hypothetical protein
VDLIKETCSPRKHKLLWTGDLSVSVSGVQSSCPSPGSCNKSYQRKGTYCSSMYESFYGRYWVQYSSSLEPDTVACKIGFALVQEPVVSMWCVADESHDGSHKEVAFLPNLQYCSLLLPVAQMLYISINSYSLNTITQTKFRNRYMCHKARQYCLPKTCIANTCFTSAWRRAASSTPIIYFLNRIWLWSYVRGQVLALLYYLNFWQKYS